MEGVLDFDDTLRILLGFQTTQSASSLPRSAVWRTIIRYKALSRLQRVETSAQPVANSSSPAWISQWAFTSKFPRAINSVFRGRVVELSKMMDLMDRGASYMLIVRLGLNVYRFGDHCIRFAQAPFLPTVWRDSIECISAHPLFQCCWFQKYFFCSFLP